MKITDTHAHYTDHAFDTDRYELLDELFRESVNKIVCVGADETDCPLAIGLADRYENMFAAVGIHPEFCDDVKDGYLDKLAEQAQNKKVVAIGEIGLDYHYDGYNRDSEIRLFREQLDLAQQLDLPVIVHSRDATKDTLDILRELHAKKPLKAQIHCFSGSAETAAEYLKMGFMISFTGAITFKNSLKAVQACAAVPTDRLMLETDCPYMAPIPFRGKRCDSGLLKHTAEKFAEIKGISTDEMINICNLNADSFFGI